MTKLIDLTRPIADRLPVYPGDPGTRLFQTKFLETDHYNCSHLEIGMHAGTHIDTPLHLIQDNRTVMDFPLETFFGNGCALDVRGEREIGFKPDYEERVKEGDIVLLFTGWDQVFGTGKYFTENPVVLPELAEFFVRKRIKLVGVDSPSPDRFPFAVHRLLFENDILIIENLTNLEAILGLETFEVLAFPLKINAEASLARVVARETAP